MANKIKYRCFIVCVGIIEVEEKFEKYRNDINGIEDNACYLYSDGKFHGWNTGILSI